MYKDRTQNYDPEMHEEYLNLIHGTPIRDRDVGFTSRDETETRRL